LVSFLFLNLLLRGDKESLAIVQRKLNVDILISGHTHQFEHYTYQNHLFLNPGSLTGAYNGVSKDSIPSLLLLDIQSTSVTTYRYYKSPEKTKVQVDKFDYQKE
jgi:vacuolar protein sorting-associated protein 29